MSDAPAKDGPLLAALLPIIEGTLTPEQARELDALGAQMRQAELRKALGAPDEKAEA